jgi:hypothetical protein
MENKTKFTAEFLEQQRALIGFITHLDWKVIWDNGIAYIMNNVDWQMMRVSIGAGRMPDGVVAVINNYPAALDEIERVQTALTYAINANTEQRREIDRLRAEVENLQK